MHFRNQLVRSLFASIVECSIILAFGSVIDTANERGIQQRDSTASGAGLEMGDLSDPNAPVISFYQNESMALNVAFSESVYGEPQETPASCVGAAVSDALGAILLSTIDYAFQSGELAGQIPYVQSNPANVPPYCNDVIVEFWLNIQNMGAMQQWRSNAQKNGSSQGLADQITDQLTTGKSIEACGLMYNVGEGWDNGFAVAVVGVEYFGQMSTRFIAPDYPSDALLSKCGGTVTSATYAQLPEYPCQSCN